MIKILLADLTHKTITISSDTMPLNIGYIASYALKTFGDKINCSLFKYPEELVERLEVDKPDILGLSNYPWNSNISCKILKLFKKKYPSKITVMGGNNFPKIKADQKKFLKERPEIDFYVYRDGEKGFVSLLTQYFEMKGDISKIKSNPIDGCIFIKDNEIVIGKTHNRIKTLDEIPSPYLMGLMDKFFDGHLTPFIETNRGCPFTCSYCYASDNYNSIIIPASQQRLENEVNYIAQKAKPGQSLILGDSNFGMYERDMWFAKLIKNTRDRCGFPLELLCTTAKNQPKRLFNILEILPEIPLTCSLQSGDRDVLNNVGRKNINMDSYLQMQKNIHTLGYKSKAELILGLPGESKESHLNAIRMLVNSGVDMILCYTCMMLEGTDLNSKETREKYGLKTKFRLIPLDFGIYEGEKCFEVEEVIVETNTLGFDDYIFLRKIHLLIFLIFSSGCFSELIQYLRLLKIDILDWILFLVSNLTENVFISKLVSQFAIETNNELFNSPEEVRQFYSDNYRELLQGEVGGNLLHKYRNIGIVQCVNNWVDFFISQTKVLMSNQTKEKELDNLDSYIKAKLNNILNLKGREPIYAKFDYDILNWIGTQNDLLQIPSTYKFYFNTEQDIRLKNELDRFGDSISSMRKILTRNEMSAFFRSVCK